jgi:DNA-binding transcriptional LysR family regulator
VHISLQSNSSAVVHDWVASQQFDVGVAEVPQERDSLTVETIETRCVCALPAGDPLARKKSLAPRDLSGKPMASLFSEHFTHRETVNAFEAAGARFNQRFELRAFVPGFAFVEQKLAYSICDPISAASYRIYRGNRGSIVFRPFEPAISYPFAILTPSYKPRSLLAEEFCGSLKSKILALL